MEIKLDDHTVKHIIKQAVEDAKRNMVTAIMNEFNPKQISAEVKNLAVKEAAGILSNELMKNPEFEKILTRTFESCESRLNTRVGKILSRGVVIKFVEEE